jgi:hypothetical protein
MHFGGYDFEAFGIAITETEISVGSKAFPRQKAAKEAIAAAMRSNRTPFTLSNKIYTHTMVFFVDGAVSVGSFLKTLDLFGDLKGFNIELFVKERK